MGYGNGAMPGYAGEQRAIAGSIAGTSTPPAQRMSLIGEQMVNLDANLREVQQVVAQLEDRLSGVLRAVPPAPVENAPHDMPVPAVPMVGGLVDMNVRVMRVIGHLRSLIDRCEL